MNNTRTQSRGGAVAQRGQRQDVAEQQTRDMHRQEVAETAQRRSILATMAGRFNMEPDAFQSTLLKTVFKNASREEFAALLVVANEYKLNPLTKEIYAFPQKGGGIVPLVSVDGWIRIMNEHPQFDGIEFVDLVDEDGVLYAIESVIWRKDRQRAMRVTEYLDECKGTTGPWQKSPKRMLRHRALIQGARIAFGFSGIYSEDEAVGDISLGGNLRPYSPPPTKEQFTAIDHQPAADDDDGFRQGDYQPEDEQTARDLDRETFNQVDGNGGGEPTEDEMLVDEWVERCERAKILGDVINVENELAKRDDLDPVELERAQAAIDAARKRFGK